MKRWKKWLIAAGGVIGVVPILAGIGLWVWERQAARALNEVIDQIQAGGAPVYVADLIPPEIPDEENAALPLRAAAAVVERQVREIPGHLLPDWFTRPPLPDEEVAVIRQLVERSEEVWTYLDEARRRRQVRWPVEYSSPMLDLEFPDLLEQRRLAEFCRWAAYLAYHEGDHALALRRLEHLPFIAEAFDHLPMHLYHLGAVGIWSSHREAIVHLSPNLLIDDSQGEAAASSEQVKAAINVLLDEASLRAGARRAYEEERVKYLDSLLGLLDGSFRDEAGPVRGSVRPVIMTDARLMLEYISQVLEVFDAVEDWPTFERELPREIPEQLEESRLHILASLMIPSIDRLAQTHYRVLADRRLAACALAVRWYAVEHEGRLPESLEALVPRYLPAVPLDPMDPAGGPIRYRPDGEEPVAYSVGENGIDNGGSTRPNLASWQGEAIGWQRWQMMDTVVYLRRQPRVEADEEAWGL